METEKLLYLLLFGVFAGRALSNHLIWMAHTEHVCLRFALLCHGRHK